MGGDGYKNPTPDADLTGSVIITLPVFVLGILRSHLEGCIEEDDWFEFGDVSVADAALIAKETFFNMFAIAGLHAVFSDIPDGWLELDGSSYLVVDYPRLAAACPSYVSGANIVLPDLRDSVVAGASATNAVGTTAGSDSHVQTVSEMPTHGHTYTPPTLNLDLEAPGAPDIFGAGIGIPTTTGSAGGGAAMDMRQKTTYLRWAVSHG